MMASPFGPGETAAVDQALAASDEDLDGLLRAIRGLIAGDGREQTVVQLALTLRQLSGSNTKRLESLLLAAVMRLAGDRAEPAGMTVAGFEDEAVEFTAPVTVRCPRCGTASPQFGEHTGDPAGFAMLADLIRWAAGHSCPAAVTAGDRP